MSTAATDSSEIDLVEPDGDPDGWGMGGVPGGYVIDTPSLARGGRVFMILTVAFSVLVASALLIGAIGQTTHDYAAELRQRLEEGDLDAWIGDGVDADATFLTEDVIDARTPPRDIRVRVVKAGHKPHLVVSYTVDSTPVSRTLGLRKAGSSWEATGSLLVTGMLDGLGGLATISIGDAAEQIEPDQQITLLPGTYTADINIAQPLVEAESSQIVVGNTVSLGRESDAPYALSADGEEALTRAFAQVMSECADGAPDACSRIAGVFTTGGLDEKGALEVVSPLTAIPYESTAVTVDGDGVLDLTAVTKNVTLPVCGDDGEGGRVCGGGGYYEIEATLSRGEVTIDHVE